MHCILGAGRRTHYSGLEASRPFAATAGRRAPPLDRSARIALSRARHGANVAPMNPRPCVLQSRFVRLEPLAEAHAEDLWEAGADREVWRFLLSPPLESLPAALDFIRAARAAAAEGSVLPFAIVWRASGRAIGSTRYLDIRSAHRGLEIGGTWIDPRHQRTSVNTECKRLLLAHAFEDLGALRVQLKTDSRNLRSQAAIERIGAMREGVLRRHMILRDGFVRDTVMYAITDEDWPLVKAKLDALLERS
jgi:N-acetyltransferase